MKYDPLTRILHLCVALGITSQLMTSLVMVAPKPDRLADAWFVAHETVGIALVGVVALYWLWIVARPVSRGQAFLFFPWFSAKRLGALRQDAADTWALMRQRRLPAADTAKPLPSAIQGLGLLLALFLAATGTTIAFGMEPNGHLSPLLHDVKEVHESVASLMWVYLVGHPLLGLLHQLAGDRVLTKMFGFNKD